MFDIGFIELLVCALIALLVLGPERLPIAARATGRWIGKARRMAGTFTSELDRQLKAEELREKIRKEGSELGAEEIQRNFQEGLKRARQYTDYVITDETSPPASASSDKASTEPAAPQDPGTSSELAPRTGRAAEVPEAPASEETQENRHR